KLAKMKPTLHRTLLGSSDVKFLIELKAECANYFDHHNILGVKDDACNQFDHYDMLEAPPIGKFIELYVDNSHWKIHPGKYSTDLQSNGEEGYIWNLTLHTNLVGADKTMNISCDIHEHLPAEWKLILFDLTAGRAFDLSGIESSAAGSYRFNLSGNAETKRKFKLIAGDEGFINKNNEGIPLVPLQFKLYQNYPNPFNPVTKISYDISQRTHVTIIIYNMLGQRVKVLVDEPMNAGHNEAIWDGLNDIGQSVASGLYFVRLDAESKTAIVKMMIVK
ncbi:T9SS type A sorting domain-containing protein, partial [candidate division KSB1 bacterium]|nr:T9SS type A sorting domain-containing protein [candidate division KSB1 bacterium]